MITVTEIAFTGYPMTDAARARAFYEGIFNLKPTLNYEHEGKQWIEYDIGSSTLALTNMHEKWKPSADGPSLAFELADFDEAVKTAKSAGVKFTLEPVVTPGCRLAIVEDPDGNALMLHQRNAK